MKTFTVEVSSNPKPNRTTITLIPFGKTAELLTRKLRERNPQVDICDNVETLIDQRLGEVRSEAVFVVWDGEDVAGGEALVQADRRLRERYPEVLRVMVVPYHSTLSGRIGVVVEVDFADGESESIYRVEGILRSIYIHGNEGSPEAIVPFFPNFMEWMNTLYKTWMGYGHTYEGDNPYLVAIQRALNPLPIWLQQFDMIFAHVSVAPHYKILEVSDAIAWLEERVGYYVGLDFAIFPDDEVSEGQARVVVVGGKLSQNLQGEFERESLIPVNNT